MRPPAVPRATSWPIPRRPAGQVRLASPPGSRPGPIHRTPSQTRLPNWVPLGAPAAQPEGQVPAPPCGFRAVAFPQLLRVGVPSRRFARTRRASLACHSVCDSSRTSVLRSATSPVRPAPSLFVSLTDGSTMRTAAVPRWIGTSDREADGRGRERCARAVDCRGTAWGGLLLKPFWRAGIDLALPVPYDCQVISWTGADSLKFKSVLRLHKHVSITRDGQAASSIGPSARRERAVTGDPPKSSAPESEGRL